MEPYMLPLFALGWISSGIAFFRWYAWHRDYRQLHKEYVKLLHEVRNLKFNYNSYEAGWKAALRNRESVFRAHREFVREMRQKLNTFPKSTLKEEDLG